MLFAAASLGTDVETLTASSIILTVTRRACRDGRRPKHKKFELMGALRAPVFVNRHLPGRYCRQNKKPRRRGTVPVACPGRIICGDAGGQLDCIGLSVAVNGWR